MCHEGGSDFSSSRRWVNFIPTHFLNSEKMGNWIINAWDISINSWKMGKGREHADTWDSDMDPHPKTSDSAGSEEGKPNLPRVCPYKALKGCCWITQTPGSLASGGEEFNPRPETRLDHSELLCNKVLLKYKGDRESFWHRHQKGVERVPTC